MSNILVVGSLNMDFVINVKNCLLYTSIASVINQMGSMAGDGIFGAIVFLVVFVFGHAFNMAINVLGAYVHTNRLQFVEFFGKFYEGGGKPFNPRCV